MGVIAAAREKFGERDLWQDSAAQAEGKLALHHLVGAAARRDPANPVAGRQALRERAAIDRIGTPIERDEWLRPLQAEIEIAIDIVLDERDVMPLQEIEQRPLVGFGHHRAERIVEA